MCQKMTGLLMVLSCICLAGCADNVRMPTPEQRAVFEALDPGAPAVDMERVNKAKLHTGPYHVVPGDVLEFTMPALLRAVTRAEIRAAQVQNARDYPFLCRVSDEGTISLPAVGELEVSGKSLAEIEADVIEAYEASAVRRPSVYVHVFEYRTSRVYITGVVKTPGVYTLRADQMTLVSLLTEAGGISEAGAALARIIRSDDQTETVERAPRPSRDEPAVDGTRTPQTPEPLYANSNSAGASSVSEQVAAARADVLEPNETPSPREDVGDRTIVLPVVGMNIPFGDVALEEGDTVVIEPVQMPLMSVLGLVRNPGNVEYPPYARYTQAQAISLAGGLDMGVEPRYATVYRLKSDGTVLRVPFKLIENGEFTENLNVSLRPGDLVAVEHTPRTRTNAFVNQVFRISVGLYFRPDELWN